MYRILACIAAASVLCGCVNVKNGNSLVPPPALVSFVTMPLTVPEGTVPCENLKKGVAKDSVYIWEWAFSGARVSSWDSTLAKAMEDGKITKVHYADCRQCSVLGYVTLYTVTAYGE